MHNHHALNLDQAIQRLNRDISQAISSKDSPRARDCCAVARFLAHDLGTVHINAIAARATAACRFLGVDFRHA